MDFKALTNKYHQDIITKISEFVQIPSVGEQSSDKTAPFGKGIKDSLLYILDLGEKLGFKTKNVDYLAGHIEFGEGEEILGILCHVDVVPADGEWHYPKFGGVIEDGKIYGRGTNDDKGPTICSLYAMKLLMDEGFTPKKRVRLILGTDEETAWRGINHYLSIEETPTLGFSPDADFPLIYGEKGILELNIIGKNEDSTLLSFTAGSRSNIVAPFASAEVLTNNDGKKEINKYQATGKSAHAMEPDNGINAALLLAKQLYPTTSNNAIKFIVECLADSRLKTIGLNCNIAPMGDMTMNIGTVHIDEENSNIGINIRYPYGMDFDSFINKLSQLASKYQMEVKINENKKPHYVNEDSPLIKTLHQAYQEVTNDMKSPIKTIGGGTYARAIPNAVAFGALFPDEKEMAHEPDEYIAIDSAIKTTAIIASAIYKLTK